MRDYDDVKDSLDSIFTRPIESQLMRHKETLLKEAGEKLKEDMDTQFLVLLKRAIERFKATTEFKYEDGYAVFKIKLKEGNFPKKKPGRPKKK
jgi:hypothetical protein